MVLGLRQLYWAGAMIFGTGVAGLNLCTLHNDKKILDHPKLSNCKHKMILGYGSVLAKTFVYSVTWPVSSVIVAKDVYFDDTHTALSCPLSTTNLNIARHFSPLAHLQKCTRDDNAMKMPCMFCEMIMKPYIKIFEQ